MSPTCCWTLALPNGKTASHLRVVLSRFVGFNAGSAFAKGVRDLLNLAGLLYRLKNSFSRYSVFWPETGYRDELKLPILLDSYCCQGSYLVHPIRPSGWFVWTVSVLLASLSTGRRLKLVSCSILIMSQPNMRFCLQYLRKMLKSCTNIPKISVFGVLIILTEFSPYLVSVSNAGIPVIMAFLNYGLRPGNDRSKTRAQTMLAIGWRTHKMRSLSRSAANVKGTNANFANHSEQEDSYSVEQVFLSKRSNIMIK